MSSNPRIRAGRPWEICMESGDWIIVDMGFSSKKPSCGVAVGGEPPNTLPFGKLVNLVRDEAGRKEAKKRPLNLLLEAPLSMAFDPHDNPMPRSFEDPNEKGHKDIGNRLLSQFECAQSM